MTGYRHPEDEPVNEALEIRSRIALGPEIAARHPGEGVPEKLSFESAKSGMFRFEITP